MSLKYTINQDFNEDFELKVGDYILDESGSDVYILSVDYYDLYTLISLSRGSRWDIPKTISEIKEDIINYGFKVYEKGLIDIHLDHKIY